MIKPITVSFEQEHLVRILWDADKRCDEFILYRRTDSAFSDNEIVYRGTGTALSNLFTYFYNEKISRWERLEKIAIDRDNYRIISLTHHFTDMVNGLDADTYAGEGKRSFHLDRDTPSASDTFTTQVSFGDALYFHLSTGDDHKGDSLSWDTTIRYESIALFDGLHETAILSPPARTYVPLLPYNDSRFAPLYTFVSNTQSSYWELVENWQELCTPEVYDALADRGRFIPKKNSTGFIFKAFSCSIGLCGPHYSRSCLFPKSKSYSFL